MMWAAFIHHWMAIVFMTTRLREITAMSEGDPEHWTQKTTTSAEPSSQVQDHVLTSISSTYTMTTSTISPVIMVEPLSSYSEEPNTFPPEKTRSVKSLDSTSRGLSPNLHSIPPEEAHNINSTLAVNVTSATFSQLAGKLTPVKEPVVRSLEKEDPMLSRAIDVSKILSDKTSSSVSEYYESQPVSASAAVLQERPESLESKHMSKSTLFIKPSPSAWPEELEPAIVTSPITKDVTVSRDPEIQEQKTKDGITKTEVMGHSSQTNKTAAYRSRTPEMDHIRESEVPVNLNMTLISRQQDKTSSSGSVVKKRGTSTLTVAHESVKDDKLEPQSLINTLSEVNQSPSSTTQTPKSQELKQTTVPNPSLSVFSKRLKTTMISSASIHWESSVEPQKRHSSKSLPVLVPSPSTISPERKDIISSRTYTHMEDSHGVRISSSEVHEETTTLTKTKLFSKSEKTQEKSVSLPLAEKSENTVSSRVVLKTPALSVVPNTSVETKHFVASSKEDYSPDKSTTMVIYPQTSSEVRYESVSAIVQQSSRTMAMLARHSERIVVLSSETISVDPSPLYTARTDYLDTSSNDFTPVAIDPDQTGILKQIITKTSTKPSISITQTIQPSEYKSSFIGIESSLHLPSLSSQDHTFTARNTTGVDKRMQTKSLRLNPSPSIYLTKENSTTTGTTLLGTDSTPLSRHKVTDELMTANKTSVVHSHNVSTQTNQTLRIGGFLTAISVIKPSPSIQMAKENSTITGTTLLRIDSTPLSRHKVTDELVTTNRTSVFPGVTKFEINVATENLTSPSALSYSPIANRSISAGVLRRTVIPTAYSASLVTSAHQNGTLKKVMTLRTDTIQKPTASIHQETSSSVHDSRNIELNLYSVANSTQVIFSTNTPARIANTTRAEMLGSTGSASYITITPSPASDLLENTTSGSSKLDKSEISLSTKVNSTAEGLNVVTSESSQLYKSATDSTESTAPHSVFTKEVNDSGTVVLPERTLIAHTEDAESILNTAQMATSFSAEVITDSSMQSSTIHATTVEMHIPYSSTKTKNLETLVSYQYSTKSDSTVVYSSTKSTKGYISTPFPREPTKTPRVQEQEFRITIKITSEEYTDELSKRTSKAFQEKSREIEQQFDRLYKNIPEYLYSKVLRFFKGSLGCNVAVILESKETAPVSKKDMETPILKAKERGSFGEYVLGDVDVKEKRPYVLQARRQEQNKTWGQSPVVVVSILGGVCLVLLVIVITQCIQKRHYSHSLGESSEAARYSPSVQLKKSSGDGYKEYDARHEERVPITTFNYSDDHMDGVYTTNV